MVWAIVPYKGVDQSKSRLAPQLTAAARRRLSQAMLEDVLQTLVDCAGLEGVLLASPCTKASVLAREKGVSFLRDRGDGLSRAVEESAVHLMDTHGVTSTIFVPGDVPLITPQDVGHLLAEHQGVTIVPDGQRIGTNAIVSSPPNAFPLRFNGRSFDGHVQLAKQAGVQPRVIESPSFGLDVDTYEDALRVAAMAPLSRMGWVMRTLSNPDSRRPESSLPTMVSEEPCAH